MSINATINRMNDLHDVDLLVDKTDHGEDVRAQALRYSISHSYPSSQDYDPSSRLPACHLAAEVGQ